MMVCISMSVIQSQLPPTLPGPTEVVSVSCQCQWEVGVNQLPVSVASVGAKVSVNDGMHFDECYPNANSH